jgi:inhibitor of KinA sporulation pathway (predicted exonuclease)
MNYSSLCVYDYETGSADADTCQIVQISAEMLRGDSLKLIDQFSSFVRPDWEADGITDATLEFHAVNADTTVD